MKLERDYAAERLARVTMLFDEVNRKKATMAPANRVLARQLVTQLDEMLRELGHPTFANSGEKVHQGVTRRPR
jgi:hypothetical protein